MVEGKRIIVVGVFIMREIPSQYNPIVVEEIAVEMNSCIPLLYNNSNVEADMNAPIKI